MRYCKKYRKTHYYLPIYGVNMNFVFNKEDFKYLLKKYQNFEPENELSDNGECYHNSLDGNVIIGIFNNSLYTLNHELIHACIFILESRGIDPLDSNGETMAYLSAHLFEVIEQRMINERI